MSVNPNYEVIQQEKNLCLLSLGMSVVLNLLCLLVVLLCPKSYLSSRFTVVIVMFWLFSVFMVIWEIRNWKKIISIARLVD